MLDKTDLKKDFKTKMAASYMLTTYINKKRNYIQSIKHLIKMSLKGHSRQIINSAFIVADAKDKYLKAKSIIENYRRNYG